MTSAEPMRKASAMRVFLRERIGFKGPDLWGHARSKPNKTHLVNVGRQKDCKGENEGRMRGMESEAVAIVQVKGKEGKTKGTPIPSVRKPLKKGPPPKEVAPSDWNRVLDGASLGIPFDRLCHLAGMTDKTFAKYLLRYPERKEEIDAAKTRGEYDLTSVVRSCGPGWQGSAWLLERTRGYVARAQLEHTGKGGKELSISGSLLGAFGGQK